MEYTPLIMSSLLKCCVELSEADSPIKKRVQDLEDFLLDRRSLKVNCLIMLDRCSIF